MRLHGVTLRQHGHAVSLDELSGDAGADRRRQQYQSARTCLDLGQTEDKASQRLTLEFEKEML